MDRNARSTHDSEREDQARADLGEREQAAEQTAAREPDDRGDHGHRDRDEQQQVVEQVRFYFEDPAELDAGARKALRKKRDFAPAVKRYAEALEREVPVEAWGAVEHVALESHAKEFLERENLKLGDLAQPVRAILTGRSATPGLFEVMSLLGRETCLHRLGRVDECFRQAEG